MRRTIATTIATLLTAATLTACGSDTPTEQAPPPAPAASTPAPSTAPTLARWVGVACTPEGATAKTSSGGDLVCKKVGSDPGPEWHAVAP